jgi:hypothetical protein
MTNEDDLLKLIMKLIKKYSNKKNLLQKIKSQTVSSKIMKDFIYASNLEDIDFNLYELLKIRYYQLIETIEKLCQTNIQSSIDNSQFSS